MVGIHGRAGAVLDAVGALCGPVVITPPSPADQRRGGDDVEAPPPPAEERRGRDGIEVPAPADERRGRDDIEAGPLADQRRSRDDIEAPAPAEARRGRDSIEAPPPEVIVDSHLPPASGRTQATPGNAFGGTGGTPFSAPCAADQQLAGLAVRVGDDVDQVSALCARIGADGRRRGEVSEVQGGGGSGGEALRLECPAHTPVVRALTIQWGGEKTTLVGYLGIECALGQWPFRSGTYLSALGKSHKTSGYTEPTKVRTDCDPHLKRWTGHPKELDTVMVGIHGRAGSMLDAFGVICGALVVTPGPADARRGGSSYESPPYVPDKRRGREIIEAPAPAEVRRGGGNIEAESASPVAPPAEGRRRGPFESSE